MSNWVAVEALSTLLTAVVALYLLGQGQQDRRRIRDDERAAQARDVLVLVHETWLAIDRSRSRFEGAEVRFRNNSRRHVILDEVRYVHHPEDEADIAVVGRVHVTPVEIEREDRMVLAGSGHVWPIYRQDGFAIVDFRDHLGRRWQRRSDTHELRPAPPSLRRWQRAFRFLCRARFVRWMLLGPWERQAFWSAKKNGAGRVPIGLAVLRVVVGEWPAGELDEWLRSDSLPPLFGCTDLYEVATGQLSYPSPRRSTRDRLGGGGMDAT